MPRPLRPIDDGLNNHGINRGNNRQDVFHKDGDFKAFLQALADLKERRPFQLFGYCLLNNHFHLLIRPLAASISCLMQSLLVSHTQHYHKHDRSGGHVWQGRFKSPVIQDDEHLLTVLRYIEANPLRANIVRHAGDYPWSSYRLHGCGAADGLLDRLINYEELSPYAAVRQRVWEKMVHRPIEEQTLAAIRRSSATGLPYGNDAWVERLAKGPGQSHLNPLRFSGRFRAIIAVNRRKSSQTTKEPSNSRHIRCDRPGQRARSRSHDPPTRSPAQAGGK